MDIPITVKEDFVNRLVKAMPRSGADNRSQFIDVLKDAEIERRESWENLNNGYIQSLINSDDGANTRHSDTLVQKMGQSVPEYIPARFNKTAVYAWFDKSSPTVPDYRQLLTIGYVCDCDVGYLVGESDTFKAEYDSIHKATGLTEDAIQMLDWLREREKDKETSDYIIRGQFETGNAIVSSGDVISSIILSEGFINLLSDIEAELNDRLFIKKCEFLEGNLYQYGEGNTYKDEDGNYYRIEGENVIAYNKEYEEKRFEVSIVIALEEIVNNILNELLIKQLNREEVK